MSVRLLIGRAGSGKSHRCKEEIVQQLYDSPIGSPLIYLVPEQMTFQAEYELAKRENLHGMMRAQVFSFRRLAWKVLGEVGGIARKHINSLGIKMVLRQVLEQNQHHLRFYGRAAAQMGFTDQLEQIFIEFKRYMIDSERIKQQVELLEEKRDEGPQFRLLSDKLHDLHLIYQEVEQRLREKYLDSEDYLRLLAQQIPHSRYMQQAEIWIDGFHGFTPQEYAVIVAMMETSSRVTITLTLDSPYDEVERDYDLFYPTGMTYLRIKQLTSMLNLPFAVQALEDSHRYKSWDLRVLEKKFGDRHIQHHIDEVQGIHLFPAVHRRAEVEGIAREVLRLTREEGFRWRDVAILVRDMDTYEPLFTTIFADYEIPIFIDRKRTMLHHPLIELLRSALEVVSQGWPTDAVLRCIKTGLLAPKISQHDLDQFENYVLEYGIHHHRWTEDKPWQIYVRTGLKKDEEEVQERIRALNELRYSLIAPLKCLQQELECSQSVRDYCQAIVHFLTQLDVPKELEKWMDSCIQHGKLERAKEHGQVWNAVCTLLDQMVEVMGEDILPLDRFVRIIESGMEGMHFSLVPTSVDQVMIGSIQSRLANVRAAFVVGVNDGVYPAPPAETSLLSESEREILAQAGIELAPSSEQRLLEEEFLMYTLLTTPSEKLYITYPLADEEGRGLEPSAYVNHIKRLFPKIKERLLLHEPTYGNDQEFISRPRPTLSQLAVQLRSWRKGYVINPLWFGVYNWYMEHDEWRDRAYWMLQSLYYTNQEKGLSKATARKLYSDHLRASISRLERFQACPFAHFADYGLGLKERPIFRLEAPDIGELFHAALDRMSHYLRKARRSWRDLDIEEVDLLAQRVVEELAPEFQKQILFSTKRMQYIGNKLAKVVSRAGKVLREHSLRSHFTPVETEVYFAENGVIPSLIFTLPNGCTLELIGRIDRVDVAQGSRGLYVRIMDYKSSVRSLNLMEVYYGIALQMLTYLDVVVSNAERWLGQTAIPAGMLYFHVHDAMVKADGPLAIEDLQRQLLLQYKMKGLLLADEESVRLMDLGIGNSRSDIIPVGFKKDGSFYQNSSVISNEQLEQLRNHVRHTIQQIGLDITEGNVQIAPYLLKKNTPCRFCAYKPVCQFDTLFEDNRYRKLYAYDKEQLWLLLQQERGD